jgi:hypothetical protein
MRGGLDEISGEEVLYGKRDIPGSRVPEENVAQPVRTGGQTVHVSDVWTNLFSSITGKIQIR